MWVADAYEQFTPVDASSTAPASSSTHRISKTIVLVGPSCAIGRNKGDITFPNDRGVSRNHGVLLVKPGVPISKPGMDNNLVRNASKLYVMDPGSTGGILVNDKQIPKNTEFLITDGSVLTLGPQKGSSSRIRIRLAPLELCATRLEKAERELLKSSCSALCAMGITPVLQEEPRLFTHLICNKFSVTTKVLGAIVYQKPIVTIAWLTEFRKDIERIRASPQDAPHSMTYPIPTSSFFPSGEMTNSLTNLDLGRGAILKNILIVLFAPSNELYVSVLEGCGASVVRMYGADPSDPSARDTIVASGSLRDAKRPRLMDSTDSLAFMFPDTSHMSLADSQARPANHSGEYSSSQGENLESMSAGAVISVAALQRRIRYHLKQPVTDTEYGCCIFLENAKKNLNTDMLAVSKQNNIGFLEPAPLATGIFSNTSPAMTTYAVLRARIASEQSATSTTTKKAIHPPVVAAPVIFGDSSSRPPPQAMPPPQLLPTPKGSPTENVKTAIKNDINSVNGIRSSTIRGTADVSDAMDLDDEEYVVTAIRNEMPVVSSATAVSSTLNSKNDALTAGWEDEDDCEATTDSHSKPVVMQPATAQQSIFDLKLFNNSEKHVVEAATARPNTKQKESSPVKTGVRSPTFKVAKDVLEARESLIPPPTSEVGWLQSVHEERGREASSASHSRSQYASPLQEKRQVNSTASALDKDFQVDANPIELLRCSPIVIERELQLRNLLEPISSDPTAATSSQIRNVKRFRKNRVFGRYELSRDHSEIIGAGLSRISRTPLLSLHEMDKVLPKESERELQLRLEVESFQKREQENDELMFADRFAITKRKK